MREEQKIKLKKIILDIEKDSSLPKMKEKELIHFLGIPKEEKKDFTALLEEMVEEGLLSFSAKEGRHSSLTAKPEEKGHSKASMQKERTLKGIYSKAKKGFGFVSLSEKELDDIYIPKGSEGNAMDGDTVQILITKERQGDSSAEGKIVKVMKRAVTEVLGLVKERREGLFLYPDNPKLPSPFYIQPGKAGGALPGDKVMAKILSYGGVQKDEKRGSRGRSPIPRGKRSPLLSYPVCGVTEVLGASTEPGVDVLSVIRAFSLPEDFPEEVKAEAAAIPMEVPESILNSKTRRDFRALTTITIDGEDAKDLDDAISLEYFPEKKLYRLYVHIADVTEYVKEGSSLDLEALERGTSVYLTDRVIPMLPRELSNGICSLHEGVDRLTLSCIMDYNEKGEQLSHEICPGIICSDKRMSYTGVTAVLEEENEATSTSIDRKKGTSKTSIDTENETFETSIDKRKEDYSSYLPFKDLLLHMRELSRLLRHKRVERGGLDFDFPESKVIFNEKGQIAEIRSVIREESHKIIEDFMLAANETVAEEYYWRDIPFLYRVHERPDFDKWQELSRILSNFSILLRAKDPDSIRPKALQGILETIKGKEEEMMLSNLILRSLKQAKYSVECGEHFGLASKYYTHFTSPIRRYPDLQIHRIIKENLFSQENEKRFAHYSRILPDVAMQSSLRERRADEAERDCMKLKKCQYMKNFLGESFPGTISGLTEYGIYVTLENGIEGMIPLRMLNDDYFIFIEKEMITRGERSGKTFRIGDSMSVLVYAVDTLSRTIDFVPAPELPEE
ncbi:ribonuclease R family protein [Oribacterium sp. oral taxon 108]|uniref:ribonuclease R family protein n=1 Tax=Oribacterium sp. oral taxon 108 TaxID=712414 RepID=UPI00020DDC32|nr:RNB domain-containing ribonuclease [Oribacterium sp. oral taxon 108]EGL36920.1 ribonuclease R [Oribacterium sp. oral taxon 108 str. F0425]